MFLHVGSHEALGESRHGGFRPGRFAYRLLTPLDAVDEEGSLFPGLVDGQFPVASERHAFGTPGSSGLHHPGLPARGVDAHTQARQLPVPEDRVLPVGLERVDGALGELQIASLRHPAS